MKYEQRTVYIVKYDDGAINKVFGIKEEADKYAEYFGLVVDEWPVEFAVKEIE